MLDGVPQLSVMFKTVSRDCNLDCGYCYFRETLYGGRGPGSPRHRISTAMLEKFVPDGALGQSHLFR
jgi:uncharacterized protein